MSDLVKRLRDKAPYFWDRVSFTVDPALCWEWQAARHERGYGRVRMPGVGAFPAHRVAYIIFTGTDPGRLEIDHLCRNPPCVNPRHLEAVTPEENKRRHRAAMGPRCSVHEQRSTGGGIGFRVRWRDDNGRQCSKTFRTRQEAEAFAADYRAGQVAA